MSDGCIWRGSASINASVIDEWRALDNVAYYDYQYGDEPYRGSIRDYYVSYSDPLWRWHLRTEQAVTERLTALFGWTSWRTTRRRT